MGKLTFITGPVRSGKSRFAVELAQGWGPETVFVATYKPDANDAEMVARVARHRAERPEPWRTLEAPEDVAQALAALEPPPSGMLLDCLTLWLGDRLHSSDSAILEAWDRQLQAFRHFPWPTIIVSNEVGWSPVPESPDLRRFRDLAGWLGQATAAQADESWLLVCGRALRLP